MTNDVPANSCIVVGAGISGLLAASELKEAGWRVIIFEEGRTTGGRMATLQVDGGAFDHGAQFFTVRSERFGGLVAGWKEAGVVEEWSRGFADASGEHREDGHPRYRCAGGMSFLPEHLARNLDVRTAERVTRIEPQDGAWEVETGNGTREVASALLLTPPVPRSLELAGSGDFSLPDDAKRQLEEITYAPCLGLAALLDGPSAVPEPGGLQIKGEPLDWIGDNQQKGISEVPGIIIHAGPEWSREHFDAEDAWITKALLSFAADYIGSHVIETSLTRWRYSWVTQNHPDSCLLATEDPPLLFCGDAFGQPKVEGAALSGLSAADKLLGREG